MKILITVIIMTFSSLNVIGQLYDADIANSNIVWKGYGEVGGFSQTGSIKMKASQINYDGTDLLGEIFIDLKSINHEDKALQKHLRAKDFFNVKKNPIAKYVISEYDGSLVYGTLHLNGKEGEVSFKLEMDPLDKGYRITGKAIVDRTQFDIKYNSSTYFQDLGNYAIKNEFDLEFDIVFLPRE